MGFLLSPRWIFGHVLCLGLVVLFVNLGFWQLRRLDDVRAYNTLVNERRGAPVQPLDEVLALGDPAAVAYRRVSASGRYLHDEEVLLGPRSRDGAPGFHVLTPLATAAGQAVIVDRGWVPFELDEAPVPQAAPPGGTVEVTGTLFPAEVEGDPDVPPDEAERLIRLDLERLDRQVDAELAPLYLQLDGQRPAQAGPLPGPVAPPALDEGNHLSYAVQWFLFATVGAVGYPLLLRHTARERRSAREPAPV